ncbi:MAG: cysteine hydrolase, partial [Lachnospiraceae bacterium]|nr:cysteine hydrolase [Lachnospiraceae bacterium]
MKDLLMVIDMQKAYLKGAPWECLDTEGAAANIARLIDSGAADGAVFTRYEYPKAPVGVWKAYNELYADINADPVNEEFVDELLPYTERFPVYVKDVYGSFSDPAIRAAVRESGADTLVVCGVVAECCVISTVCGAVDEGLKVIYLTDAVSGITP